MKVTKFFSLIVVLIVIAVSGCSIDGWEVNTMLKECEEHGGVDVYRANTYIVTCNDGHNAEIGKDRIRESK